MRVAAYIRVSTPLQVKLETIEHQLEMVRRYVEEKAAVLEVKPVEALRQWVSSLRRP